MLALGIIGEYVGRMHLNVNRRPQYRVREILERRGESEAGRGPADGIDSESEPRTTG